MSTIVKVEDFITKSENIPVVDVRSPSEFQNGHIPGAINIPLFDDEERAIIGTKYKQIGREEAVLEGLDIVGHKLKKFVVEAKQIALENKLLVHCWRGGMRSSSMAWLFEFSGIKCDILEGGYKSYRRFVRNSFQQERKIFILGGLTGSGKTEMLDELERLGQQVLNLENIANHKGSAFGGLGMAVQPTNEQFENDVFNCWYNFNTSNPIWIEDESQLVGKAWIPDPLFLQMRKTKVIKIEVSKAQRINRLVRDYASFDKDRLSGIIQKIAKRLGGQHAKSAIEAIENDNFSIATDIILNYYDKSYIHGLSKRDPSTIFSIEVLDEDMNLAARKILKFSETLG